MSIQAALNHVTHYTYDRLVNLGPQMVRLRPAPHCRSKIISYSLKVEPEGHFVNWQQDPFANYQARLVFPDKTKEFKVSVDLVVEMAVYNPFDYFLEPSAEEFPFTYEPQLKEELTYLQQLLKIYRHHLLRVDRSSEVFRGIDLESAETWSKWGLGRGQLAALSAVVGGSAGLALDLMTGGLSHGLGVALGALTGGGAAWFKGGSLPDLKVTLTGGVRLGTGAGKSLTMGPPKNPNFPWVLLDGVLTRYMGVLARAHGRRDEELLAAGEGGFTRDFPAARRALLGKWFSSCLKGTPNRALEPEVFEALVKSLDEVEVTSAGGQNRSASVSP